LLSLVARAAQQASPPPRSATGAIVSVSDTALLPPREPDRPLVQAEAIQSSERRLKSSLALAALQQAHRSESDGLAPIRHVALLVAQTIDRAVMGEPMRTRSSLGARAATCVSGVALSPS
jgi:hypothetical protein